MEANMSFQDQLDSALSMVLGRERVGRHCHWGQLAEFWWVLLGFLGGDITQIHPSGQVPGFYLLEKEASNGVQREESQKIKGKAWSRH